MRFTGKRESDEECFNQWNLQTLCDTIYRISWILNISWHVWTEKKSENYTNILLMWRENDPFVMGINIWQGVESTVRGGGRRGTDFLWLSMSKFLGTGPFSTSPQQGKPCLEFWLHEIKKEQTIRSIYFCTLCCNGT